MNLNTPDIIRQLKINCENRLFMQITSMSLIQKFSNLFWWIFMIHMSLMSRIILFSMGWSLLNNSIYNELIKYDRTVLIFSHTSYADFYILILYILTYPNLRHVRTLIKPQPFKYAGNILTKLGAIPSTKLEDKNGGAVSRIISELKQDEKFIFLISPKGTIMKKEWRSGYYHIAKDLDAELRVIGLDYEKKQVYMSPQISHRQNESIVRQQLFQELKKIVPLVPESEVVEIRPHDPTKRTIINMDQLIKVISSIILIGIYLWFWW